MSDVTVQSLKALARSLRSDTVSHSQALELVARQHGFKDWNAAAALAPKEPTQSNFDRAVARIDALGDHLRDMQMRSQRWRESPTYPAFLNEVNAHVAWIIQHLNTEQAAACLRYMIMYQHMRLSFSQIPALLEFADRHQALIMDHDWLDSVYPKYFPGLPEHSPYAQHKPPFGYSELVREVSKRVKHDPDTTAEEVIAYLTRVHRGRAFNENTVRGLIKRGPDLVRSENRLLNRNHG